MSSPTDFPEDQDNYDSDKPSEVLNQLYELSKQANEMLELMREDRKPLLVEEKEFRKQQREERRAHFAAMAMQGLLASKQDEEFTIYYDNLADVSVKLADALLKALSDGENV